MVQLGGLSSRQPLPRALVGASFCISPRTRAIIYYDCPRAVDLSHSHRMNNFEYRDRTYMSGCMVSLSDSQP